MLPRGCRHKVSDKCFLLQENSCPLIIDMIYRIEHGSYSLHTYLAEQGVGAEWLKTIANSSMLYFGFYVQEFLGVIFRPTMETGKIPIGASVDGEIKAPGKTSWSC